MQIAFGRVRRKTSPASEYAGLFLWIELIHRGVQKDV